MKIDLRRVLAFGLGFVPAFLILLLLYLEVLPWYRTVPEGLANSLLGQTSPPSRIEPLPGGGWQAFVEAGTKQQRAFVQWQPFVVHLLFLNLALVPALLLATPVPIPERLRLLAWAIPLLLAVQTLSLIALVRGQLCLVSSPGSFPCLWLLRSVYASGQLSAAALWALLTWRYWLPGIAGSSKRSLAQR